MPARGLTRIDLGQTGIAASAQAVMRPAGNAPA